MESTVTAQGANGTMTRSTKSQAAQDMSAKTRRNYIHVHEGPNRAERSN